MSGVEKFSGQNLFVATPTHICKRYCADRFISSLTAAVPDAHIIIANNSKADVTPYYRSQRHPNLEVMNFLLDDDHYGKVDSVHRRIVSTINLLRDMFLRLYPNCTYFLSLESDVRITPDTVPALLSHNVPVVTANCYPGFFKEKEYCQVHRLTMGCTLVRRDVIQSIPFRYDPTLLKAHYDALFAHDCAAAGIRMYYDPSIVCEHMEDGSGKRGWNQLPHSERKGN